MSHGTGFPQHLWASVQAEMRDLGQACSEVATGVGGAPPGWGRLAGP